MLKLAVQARLDDNWTLTPARFQQSYKSAGIDASHLSVGRYQSANVGAPLAIFQTNKIVRKRGTDKLTLPSITLNGDVGFADFPAVVSSYKRRFERTQDGSYVNSVGGKVTDPTLAAQVGVLPSLVNLNNRIDQNSAEVRLASRPYAAGGSPLTGIAGAFMARAKSSHPFLVN